MIVIQGNDVLVYHTCLYMTTGFLFHDQAVTSDGWDGRNSCPGMFGGMGGGGKKGGIKGHKPQT